ncbi:MAG: ATP-binding cassette domain-containing protein [Firmicutes bacterium]|nr:ATP-binding cassette domain-containing protein [[Eubacterium] siraeum]MCM1487982.1 ATP-binding cassette domain-containing protein [Bacillota bacterium]
MSLSVTGITKKYGDFTAVDALSFEISKPGVFALLGTNGAGKTTSIRIILGMLAKDSGTVTWKGNPVRPAEENVGYLAEDRGLYPKINILDQMHFFASLKGIKKQDAQRDIDYWFDRLNINEYRKKIPNQLSKGNQQKVQLAAALVGDPELLVLDEPLSGLDPVNADLFKSVIREEMSKNKFIIMSSHQMNIIEEFCDDIVILNKGKTVLQGNLNEIKKAEGRVNLLVKSDYDFMPIALETGLAVKENTPNGVCFTVKNEEQAQQLLRKMVEQGKPPVKFELREPTLNEIFIERVGESNEV